MPRRRPREEEESAAGVILALALIIAIPVMMFSSLALGILIILGGVWAAAVIARIKEEAKDRYMRSQRTLSQLRNMSPTEFEQFLGWLFRQQGYEVKMTGRKGDHGVDLLLYKDGRTYGVQAKRFRKRQNVGEPMLREFYGSFEDFGIQEGYFVTTSDFTQAAIEWAVNKRGRLKLINGEELIRMVQHLNNEEA